MQYISVQDMMPFLYGSIQRKQNRKILKSQIGLEMIIYRHKDLNILNKRLKDLASLQSLCPLCCALPPLARLARLQSLCLIFVQYIHRTQQQALFQSIGYNLSGVICKRIEIQDLNEGANLLHIPFKQCTRAAS